jgi:hypothetical protein
VDLWECNIITNSLSLFWSWCSMAFVLSRVALYRSDLLACLIQACAAHLHTLLNQLYSENRLRASEAPDESISNINRRCLPSHRCRLLLRNGVGPDKSPIYEETDHRQPGPVRMDAECSEGPLLHPRSASDMKVLSAAVPAKGPRLLIPTCNTVGTRSILSLHIHIHIKP